MLLAAESKFDEIAATVLIDVAIIVVVARLMGALFRRLRQPAVVGEILAGIALGPSLLGLVPGAWFGWEGQTSACTGAPYGIPDWLFPCDVRPFLKIIAEIGLVIFMFIVGLELDVKLIRGRERIAAGISLTSVVLPFGLGMLLAGALYGSHKVVQGEEVEFLPFALFIGISMSITAFPVLARILTERGMHRTPVGALALAAAAVDDILAWSLLAVVLAVVQSSGGAGGFADLFRIVFLSVLFVVVMFTVVRPLLAKLVPRYERAGRLTPDILAVVIVGFLVSAYITAKIGIHDIFGAFVFGAVMPREKASEFTHQILERLEQVSVLLLLPVFFIATGLNVNIKGLGGAGLVQLVLVMIVAVSGKFVGATLAARAQGISWSRAASLGTLMNTRGLTELVILNVGLSAGVLTNDLFTILVCMAVLTTIMTEPLLRVFYPDRKLRRDIAEAERAALGVPDAYRVVVAVGEVDDATAANLTDIAIGLVGDEQPAEIVLCRFQPQVQKLELGTGLTGELGSFADALGSLHNLTQRAEQAGIPCTVRSQFTLDPMAELLVQAEAVLADVLLIPLTEGDAWSDKRLSSGEVDCAILGVADPELPLSGVDQTAVVIDPVAGDADALVEVGARLAHARRSPLVIRGSDDRASRRANSAAQRVGGPVEVRTDSAATSAAVVVTDAPTVPATNGAALHPTLLVKGAPDAKERLDKLTTRLTTPVTDPT